MKTTDMTTLKRSPLVYLDLQSPSFLCLLPLHPRLPFRGSSHTVRGGASESRSPTSSFNGSNSSTDNAILGRDPGYCGGGVLAPFRKGCRSENSDTDSGVHSDADIGGDEKNDDREGD